MLSISPTLSKLLVISAFVASLLVVLPLLKFFDDDFNKFFDNLQYPEKLINYASTCKHDWSHASVISETIQQRLHKTMPNPRKIIAIKSNSETVWKSEASLKVFSIDAHMGYVVQMTPSSYPKIIEKKIEKSLAEQIFFRLTEGNRRDVTGVSLKPEDVVYTSRYQACEFLKLVYPTGSVQADFIEGTVSYATLDQTHTGVRILTNAHRFFAEMQAESEMHTMQWDEKYFDYRKYLWRIKRNFKNLFFELPNTSRKPLE